MQPATREEPCEQRTKLPVWANTHRLVILTFCCVVCNANLFFTFNKTFITLKKKCFLRNLKKPQAHLWKRSSTSRPSVGATWKNRQHLLCLPSTKAPYSNGTPVTRQVPSHQAGSQSQMFEVGGHQYLLNSRWSFMVLFWRRRCCVAAPCHPWNSAVFLTQVFYTLDPLPWVRWQYVSPRIFHYLSVSWFTFFFFELNSIETLKNVSVLLLFFF